MKLKTMTLALAAAAALGAISLASAPASARGFHGGKFHGGFHAKHWGGGHWGHRRGHWGHRRHWGIYGAPVFAASSYYAAECYFARRPSGRLIRVCE